MLFTVIGYNEEREGRKVVICYGYLPTFPTRELLSRSVHSENTHNHRVLAREKSKQHVHYKPFLYLNVQKWQFIFNLQKIFLDYYFEIYVFKWCNFTVGKQVQLVTATT